MENTLLVICVGINIAWIFQNLNLYSQEPSLYVVKGIAILDNDGKRILAKYYDTKMFPTAKEQRAFEKNMFNKTHRASVEIVMLENTTCVYRSYVDLFFYVIGSNNENEVTYRLLKFLGF